MNSRERRNSRFRMSFPVRIDVPGQTPEEPLSFNTKTISVSKAGATLDADQSVPLGIGVEVHAPFGPKFLAEVNGCWTDEETGRYRISIRLIDPPDWTGTTKAGSRAGSRSLAETKELRIKREIVDLIAEYTLYTQEKKDSQLTLEESAELILDRALQNISAFQRWRIRKRLEEMEAKREIAETRKVKGSSGP